MQLTKFYDKQKKRWAIRYGEQIEYFNHENPLHDKRILKYV